LAITNGGTGQITANAGLNALLPSQTSNSGKVLSTNGTDTSWISSSGTGTVTSVAASVPSFLSVAGSPITSSGTLAITYSGTALPILNGGTGQSGKTAAFDALSPTTTKGDLIVNNGTNNIRIPVGTDTYVLTADSTQASGLAWAAASGGGLTQAQALKLVSLRL